MFLIHTKPSWRPPNHLTHAHTAAALHKAIFSSRGLQQMAFSLHPFQSPPPTPGSTYQPHGASLGLHEETEALKIS